MKSKLLKVLSGLVCMLGGQNSVLSMNNSEEIQTCEQNINRIQCEINRVKKSIPDHCYPWQQAQVQQKICFDCLLQCALKNQQNKLDNLYAESEK